MRVALARNAVRSPACVRNADASLDRQLDQRLLECTHLADRAQSLHVAGMVDHGDSGRIIAAVLEPLESLDQNRCDVAIGDATDYAAHVRPVLAASAGARSWLVRELAGPFPLLDRDLARARQRQPARRRIARDGRARADGRPVTDLHRRNQHRARTDEGAAADLSAPFIRPIVIAGDRTGPDVDAAADVRIPRIAQMIDLAAIA